MNNIGCQKNNPQTVNKFFFIWQVRDIAALTEILFHLVYAYF